MAVPPDIQLFDFERVEELEGWTPLRSHEGNPAEPALSFGLSPENATSGRHNLKITFGGGQWPTLFTTNVPADWSAYETFEASVTVSRPCLVEFLEGGVHAASSIKSP